jgi:IclR family transcriptional regulator, KDG regulon repressor
MEALAMSRSGLGVTELANMVGATKSRIHRHLATLTQAGYVARDGRTEKYRTGPSMVVLAQAITSGVDLLAVARPALGQLRDDFGHTAVLASREGDKIRILDVALGNSDFAIMQRPGNVLAPNTLHCSALGKVALAFGPHDFLEDVLSQPLPKLTKHTINDRRALTAELDRVRERGWACVPDEAIIGFNAVAVPIFDGQDNLAAMIGVIAATRVLAAKPPRDLLASVRHAGAQISAALGKRAPIAGVEPPVTYASGIRS